MCLRIQKPVWPKLSCARCDFDPRSLRAIFKDRFFKRPNVQQCEILSWQTSFVSSIFSINFVGCIWKPQVEHFKSVILKATRVSKVEFIARVSPCWSIQKMLLEVFYPSLAPKSSHESYANIDSWHDRCDVSASLIFTKYSWVRQNGVVKSLEENWVKSTWSPDDGARSRETEKKAKIPMIPYKKWYLRLENFEFCVVI